MRKLIVLTAALLALTACSASNSVDNDATEQGNATAETGEYQPLKPSDPIDSWTDDLRGYPQFDSCVDERNKNNLRKTYGDLDNLTPCWNSFLHIKTGKDDAPGFAGGNVPDVVNGIMRLDNLKESPENTWYFEVLLREDNTTYQVGYGRPDAIEQWEIYYKKGDEPWQIAGNLNDYSFPVGGQLEVIFVAHNPALPADDAEVSDKLPFAWDQVSKGWYVPHFE